MPAAAAAGRSWSTASSTRTSSGNGARCRRLLRLDDAEVEEVVDDARQALRLLHDPIGERTGHRRVVLGDQGLGQHLQRADRRLELVAHVGHEVAAHALDPVHLRHVGDERRHAERAVHRADRHRPEVDDGTRRPEQLQLTVAPLTLRRPRERARRVHRRPRHRRGAPRDSARPRGCGRPRCHRHRARGRPDASSASAASELVAPLLGTLSLLEGGGHACSNAAWSRRCGLMT